MEYGLVIICLNKNIAFDTSGATVYMQQSNSLRKSLVCSCVEIASQIRCLIETAYGKTQFRSITNMTELRVT